MRAIVELLPGCEVSSRSPGLAALGLALSWTPCHFGGSRPWLVCPGCQTRRLRLHRRDGRFRCRVCLGASYWSQRLRSVDRAHNRRRNLRRALGSSGDLRAAFPEKPPRMHWRTYFRALAQEEELQDRIAAAVWPTFVRSEKRVSRLLAYLDRRKTRGTPTEGGR